MDVIFPCIPPPSELDSYPDLSNASYPDDVPTRVGLSDIPPKTQHAFYDGDLNDTSIWEDIFGVLLDVEDVEWDQRDLNGWTPLHKAALLGRKEEVETLLAQGADVDAVALYPLGFTALHFAARSNQAEIAGILLAAGADVEAKTETDGTALCIAAKEGHVNVLKKLLTVGRAKTYPQRPWAGLPVMLAASHGHAEAVKVLVDIGKASVHCRERDETPLHIASAEGHVEVVTALLERGANRLAKDGNGRKPIDVARGNDRKEVVEALQGG